ncbi:synaptotagmin-14-like [Spea bombifrons]|uniref:synaptotagmin-14-like n=1 Tax=Spea bombifrons TaxID=233779 RepID=UPI00234A6965|nr:synaptotagmin-14-like [Spea bombifrons]
MAIDGGERTCGVHELICIRKVSPEAIGFLSAIGVSVVLVLFLFYYINRKMWPGRDGGFHCAKPHRDPDLHGSSSESEDEAVGKYHEAMTRLHGTRPGPDKQPNYMWETRQKYSPLSAEYDGYSSEVSADEVLPKGLRAPKVGSVSCAPPAKLAC